MSHAPKLNRDLLKSPAFANRIESRLLDLPEKAVQFGTGGFLRGFVDYFIDEANRQERFGGRVVAISSTGSSRDEQFHDQDGLYTLSIQGVERGVPRAEYRLITAISRALSARSEWAEVLRCARNPELKLIFSNTTEVGIRLDDADTLSDAPPRSFPAKLTRFLHERARAFDYADERGVVVIPCELIEDNGALLRSLVLEQAKRWRIENEFGDWLGRAVAFCNTLVDRIVPGTADAATRSEAARELGYADALLTNCEVYRLFAIGADLATRERLSFAAADENIILTDDVKPYRDRKVRLLNGTHTLMAPISLLAGCATVLDAVSDELVGAFTRQVLLLELVPSTDVEHADAFAREVLDRFANPFIRHALVDITLQQTEKLRVRVVPAVLDYAARQGSAPRGIAFGFAAFLFYLRDAEGPDGRPDDHAEEIRNAWRAHAHDLRSLADAVSRNRELWGTDLRAVPGFVPEVAEALDSLARVGPRAALEAHLGSSAGVR